MWGNEWPDEVRPKFGRTDNRSSEIPNTPSPDFHHFSPRVFCGDHCFGCRCCFHYILVPVLLPYCNNTNTAFNLELCDFEQPLPPNKSHICTRSCPPWPRWLRKVKRHIMAARAPKKAPCLNCLLGLPTLVCLLWIPNECI